MENDKYVVFKREDWQAIKASLDRSVGGGPYEQGQIAPLDDAVVIRRQDIFAGPGLFAYANAIQTAIDLLKTEQNDATWFHPSDERRLEELRDFFWEQAMMASHEEVKKIPD